MSTFARKYQDSESPQRQGHYPNGKSPVNEAMKSQQRGQSRGNTVSNSLPHNQYQSSTDDVSKTYGTKHSPSHIHSTMNLNQISKRMLNSVSPERRFSSGGVNQVQGIKNIGSGDGLSALS
jgi:hypothetical protein